MEPIIAPSTLYWIEVIGNIKTCSGIFFGISIAALLIFLIFFSDDYASKDYFRKTLKKARVITTVATTIFGFSCLFTPSQETLVAMTAAKYITPDNIAAVGGTAEDSIEFIINEIIRVIEASDNKDDANS